MAPAPLAGRALLDRVFLAARLELVAFLVIVSLMVVKPNVG